MGTLCGQGTQDKHLDIVERKRIMTLRALGVRSCFCAPYHTLGELVRRFVPKGTELATITDEVLGKLTGALMP
jgi:IS30 family transposase